MIRGKARTLRNGKVSARDTSIQCKINDSRKKIIENAWASQWPDRQWPNRHQDRLQPQKLWCAFQSPPKTKGCPQNRKGGSTGHE